MDRLPKEEKKKKLSVKDLNELAKWDLNGREIKNSIKTVRNWCVVQDLEMSLERLESGIRSTAPQAMKIEEGGEGDEREDDVAPGAKRQRGSLASF